MVKPEDEYRHPDPDSVQAEGLWGDTLWVSVVDPTARIFGINHFHLTTKGFARYLYDEKEAPDKVLSVLYEFTNRRNSKSLELAELMAQLK